MATATAIQAAFTTGVSDIIKLMGSNHTIKNPKGTAMAVRGVVTKSTGETSVVNAVDDEGLTFYCSKITPAPEKFTRITDPDGKVFIAQAVHDLMINDVVVCYRIKVKK